MLAEFARASDAVSAALAFQVENRRENNVISDDIQPQIRVGIALGEVVIADGTVTGAGVVLAQRLEQLAEELANRAIEIDRADAWGHIAFGGAHQR